MLNSFIKNIIMSADRDGMYEECIYTFNTNAEFKQLNDTISVKRYDNITHTFTTYNYNPSIVTNSFILMRNLIESN